MVGLAWAVERAGCSLGLFRTIRLEEAFSVADTDVLDKVKKIIVDQLGVDEANVTPEASFIEDLGADSLDIVELIMALEEEFGVEIPDEDAEKIVTVRDAIKYISEHAK